MFLCQKIYSTWVYWVSLRVTGIHKLSYDLAVKVHKLSLKLPKHETYEEGSRIRRSSKSVTSSIVEGYGRKRYKSDFIKFLVYAHASCDEPIAHLKFIKDTQETLVKRTRNPIF